MKYLTTVEGLDAIVASLIASRRITISLVECLASCGTAPVMQINETYHENLDEEKVNKILGDLR